MKHSINKKNQNTFINIMNLDKDDLEFLSLIMSHRNIIDVQKAYKHKPCEPCYDDRQYISIESPHPLEIYHHKKTLIQAHEMAFMWTLKRGKCIEYYHI